MKYVISLILLIGSCVVQAQIINKEFNHLSNASDYPQGPGIVAAGNTIGITCRVVYNAIPDGYLVTYTTTFIAESVAEAETQMNGKTAKVIREVKTLGIEEDAVLVDVIALDPIFAIYTTTPSTTSEPEPTGYKITQNLTFNLKEIAQFSELSIVCMNNGIYDVIATQAYLNSSKAVYDSLATKAVEVLNHKKELAKAIGWSFSNGEANFTKTKNVFYPSERYLKSRLKNSSLYTHHLSQNSMIDVQRRVEVDQYFNLNLKDVDFVYNASETNPVIQFYYQIDYNFVHKDTEAEMREQIREEIEEEHEKTFYILDRDGKLRVISLD